MRYLLVAALLAALPASGGRAQTHDGHDGHQTSRHASVAARGVAVMPFDLERTLHRFAPTADGGVQSVTSTDGDARQIALVRAHLAAEAKRFARGDFRSPAAIHGAEMPGLAVLAAAESRLTVTYADVANGGQLRFRSANGEVVAAVHRWFAAQTADHGRHAAPAH